MSKLEFKRGDNVTHFFVIPTSSWSAGGTLFFAAKPKIDDDMTDQAAIINQTFTDSVAVNDGVTVTYTLAFPPSATSNILSNGDKSRKYLAEFQFVSAGGQVTTFPGRDNFLEAVVYFDVRRSIS